MLTTILSLELIFSQMACHVSALASSVPGTYLKLCAAGPDSSFLKDESRSPTLRRPLKTAD